MGSLAPDATPAFLAWAARRTLPGLTMQPPSLEQLFLRHYGPADDDNDDDGSSTPSAPPVSDEPSPPLREVRAERASNGAARDAQTDHTHGRHARTDEPER